MEVSRKWNNFFKGLNNKKKVKIFFKDESKIKIFLEK